MRLTVRFLGLDLLDVSLSTGDEVEESCSLDGGGTYSQPISFLWRPGEGIDHVPESPYEDE